MKRRLVIIALITGPAPIAVVVIFAVRAASSKLIDLHEVAVIIDVDVVPETAFAGLEAVRQARPLDFDVIVTEIAERVFGLAE